MLFIVLFILSFESATCFLGNSQRIFRSSAYHLSSFNSAFGSGSSDELKIQVGEILKPLIPAGICIGGPINSIEIYACQPETMDLTVGQIAAWMQVERFSIRDMFTHSLILASLDRTRVIHCTGWKGEGINLFYTFEDFKRRADGKDGTPAALKESTHLYRAVGQYPPQGSINLGILERERYPLFTFDVFTSRQKEDQDPLVQALRSGLVAIADGGAPEQLKSIHLLRSTDPLSACVVGAWGEGLSGDGGDPTAGPPKLRQCQGYSEALAEAKKLAVCGSLSDFTDKTDPLSRMFFVCEVILP